MEFASADADDVARELDDRALETEAQAEVRDLVFARVVGGEDLALDAAMAEAAGHEDAGRALEAFVDVLLRQRLRIDPADARIDLVRPGGVLERLGDREVGIRQLDVLADEGDLEDRLGRLDPGDEGAPLVEVRLDVGVAEPELANDQTAEAGGLEHERDLVDRVGGLGRDDRVGRDVREQRDLLADLVGDRMIASAGR